MPGFCLRHELIIGSVFKDLTRKQKKRVFNGYPFLSEYAPNSVHGCTVLLVSGPKS